MDDFKAIIPTLEKCHQIDGDVPDCSAARTAVMGVDNTYGGYYPDFDYYDIRAPSDDPFPPATYIAYLNDPAIVKAIGANPSVVFTDCSDPADLPFATDGDTARSFIPSLSSVVQSGVRTVIWAGDADAACDWFGGLASVNTVQYPGHYIFKDKPVTNYTVDGAVGGTFKSVGNLSWLRVFNSGHEIPAYHPALAFQVFKQTISKTAIHST